MSAGVAAALPLRNRRLPVTRLVWHGSSVSQLFGKGLKMSVSLRALWNDEVGFIVSAELILVATILVIGLVVGLSEVQHALVSELNDVADAVGSINQGFRFSGLSAVKSNDGCGSFISGSRFHDSVDTCDNNQNSLACDEPQNESSKY